MKHFTPFLLLIFVSCSTIQNIPKPPSKYIEENKARIRLYRQNEFIGSARVFTIYSNNQEIGQIGTNGTLEWDVDPGIVTIRRKNISSTGFEPATNNSVKLTVKSGYIYTVDVIWKGFYQKPKISSLKESGIKVSDRKENKNNSVSYIENKNNYKLQSQSNPNLDFFDFILGTKNVFVVVGDGEKFHEAFDEEGEIRETVITLSNTITKHLHSLGFEYVAITKDQIKNLQKPQNRKSLCDAAGVSYSFTENNNFLEEIIIEFVSCLGDRYIFYNNDVFNLNNNLQNQLTNALKSTLYFEKARNPDKRLKLPIEMTNWNENKLKEYLDNNGSLEIEGIYERMRFGEESGAKYKIGIVKNNNDGFDVIYLKGADNFIDWEEGEKKAQIIKTAKNNFYKVEWRMADKSINEDVYSSIDKDALLNFVFTDGNNVDPESKYLKLYPLASNSYSTPSINSNYTSSGTGFFIEESGYIVTNHHVVDNMKSIDVFINDGRLSTKKYSAIVEIKDKGSDLAIIKITDKNFEKIKQLPYSIRTDLLKIGEDVFTLGYPLITTMGESVKLTSGIISSKVGFNDDLNSYQISVPIQPGNSGGPLFDLKGSIVGVINATHSNTDNVGYAIKSNVLSNILDLVELKIPTNNKINKRELSYFGEQYSNYIVIIKGY